jgi:hypothetical protein
MEEQWPKGEPPQRLRLLWLWWRLSHLHNGELAVLLILLVVLIATAVFIVLEAGPGTLASWGQLIAPAPPVAAAPSIPTMVVPVWPMPPTPLVGGPPSPTPPPVSPKATPVPVLPPPPVAPVVIVHYYYQRPNGTWAEQPGPAAPVSAEPRASTDAGTAAPVAPAGEDLGGDVIVYKGGLPYRRHKSSFLGIEIYDDIPLYQQSVPQFDPQRDTMELDLPGFQIWRGK